MSDTVEVIASALRERLLDAMRRCLVERRYADITVADIVREAKTSRRAFYQEFADKQDCIFALLIGTTRTMVASIADEVDQTSSWRDQIRQAVAAYISSSESHPEVTRSWIRVLPALGDAASDLHREAVDTFVTMLISLTDTEALRAAGIHPMSRATAILIWGGIRELTAQAVESGRPLRTIGEPATAACIALVGANIQEYDTDEF